MFQKKKIWLVSFFLIIISSLLIGCNNNPKEDVVKKEPIKNKVEDTSKFSKAPRVGDVEAENVVVEFTEYKCSYCKQWTQTIYPSLKSDYLDTGKAKLYIVPMTFLGPDSELAVLAGESIYHQNQELYHTYYELMYDNQQSQITKDFILDLVKENMPEVNIDILEKDIKDRTYANKLDYYKGLVEEYGVDSTPTIYVNDQKVTNWADYELLKAHLEGKDLMGDLFKEFENTQPFIGDPNAPVTMVEFLDYKCSYCKKWSLETYPQFKEEYIDTGKVKLYVANLAFLGPDSKTGALAGLSIFNQDPKSFEKFNELLYEQDNSENAEWITEELIISIVETNLPNINIETLKKDIKEETYLENLIIGSEYANLTGVSGTPSLVYNHKLLKDPFDYNLIVSTIEDRENIKINKSESTITNKDLEPKSSVSVDHIHGLGYGNNPETLIISTHHGLKKYKDGKWLEDETLGHDYMGISFVHDGFYTSGHPAQGSELPNPLGIMKGSFDEKELKSLTLLGEVDFHTMTVGYNTHTIYVLNEHSNSIMKDKGIYYSDDKTDTWNKVNGEGIEGEILTMKAHPDTSNKLYVGTQKGMFLSEDYGNTFTKLLDGAEVTSIEVLNDEIVFIGGYQNKPVFLVFMGVDRVGLNKGLQLSSDEKILYISSNRNNPSEVSVVTSKNNILMTNNEGASWEYIVKEGKSMK